MTKTISYTNAISKIAILAILLMATTINASAQGGWDMKYIALDSLNPSLLGKEIRIDFKTSIDDTLKGKVSALDIRKLLSKKDTILLLVESKSLKFLEDWNLYPDHGVLKEQTLINIDTKHGMKMHIGEILLAAIDQLTLSVEITIYNLTEQRKNEVKKAIIINKSDIKGILLRI